MKYDASSRGYLERARMRMRENTGESLIYAALELRAGIEARYHEYLDVWAHISDNVKKGWQLAMLGKEAQKAFKIGDKVVEVTIADENRENVSAVIYHTPVSKALHKRGEKLGDFLHAVRSGVHHNEQWWTKLRTETDYCANALAIANTGILLGPPLMRGKRINTNIEIPPGHDTAEFRRLVGGDGDHVMMNFAYLDALPDPLPPRALFWDMRAAT
jgi:hypothetical protein